MSRVIFGLSGFARTGKDTVGDYLVSKGYTKFALADAVRQAAYNANPIIEVSFSDMSKFGLHGQDAVGVDTMRMFRGFFRLQFLVDTLGWEKAKEIEDVRETLQKQGTEAGREIHGYDCWLRIAKNKIKDLDKVVFTDVRFPNEAEFIRGFSDEAKTCVIRLDRPEYGSVNSHSSDAGLCSELYDYHIDNDGGIRDLHLKVDTVLGLI